MTISLTVSDAGQIGHITARQILTRAGIDKDSAPDDVAKMMRVLYPLDNDLATRVRERAQASLTELADPDAQIRFFRLERITRNHFEILQHVASSVGPQEVNLLGPDPDELTRRFLTLAARSFDWSITRDYTAIPAPSSSPDDALTDTERAFLDRRSRVAANPLSEEAETLADDFADYLNSGDPWTVAELGRDCLSYSSPGRLLRNIALAHVLTDRTEAAEKYYNLWYQTADNVGKARALYGIAMLYSRRHPKGLLSLNRAEQALQEGYDLIRDVEGADDHLVFDRVFNRNGYALILFRRGEVEKAVELMEWGIGELSTTEEHIAIHRSVLIYNLSQCYRQLRDVEAEKRTLERLLDVDGKMPEYWLEYSKFFSRQGSQSEAHIAAERAVSLGGGLGESYAVRGNCELELHKYDDAVKSYRMAFTADPTRDEWLIDRCYALALGDRPGEALETLQSHRAPSDPRQRCRWTIMLASLTSDLQSPESGSHILRTALDEAWADEYCRELTEALNALC